MGVVGNRLCALFLRTFARIGNGFSVPLQLNCPNGSGRVNDTAGVPAGEADAGFRLAGACLKGLKKADFIVGRCDVKYIHYRTQEQGIADRAECTVWRLFPEPGTAWVRMAANPGKCRLAGAGNAWNWQKRQAPGMGVRPVGVYEAACFLRIRAMPVEAGLSRMAG